MAKIMKSSDDSVVLQNAINKFKLWCDTNYLHLNFGKCAALTIYENKMSNTLRVDYVYGDHTFKKVYDIESITAKAMTALGFVKRYCSDISDSQTLKSLYYALVQSNLEYCSVVCLPFYEVHKEIESILKQFTMFACKEYSSKVNNYKITPYDRRLVKL